MELFLVYLWLKLDSVIVMLFFISALCGLFYGLAWIPRSDGSAKAAEEEKIFIKWHNRSFFIGFIALLFSVFLPTSKDTAILVGTSIAIDVAESPEGTKIATLLRGKANELLDEQLKQLKGE